jgi:hypothetical protein
MPQELSQGNCKYVPLNTAGTTTLNQGPALAAGGLAPPNPTATFGVLYGVATIAAGTSFGVTLYDIQAPTGLGTNTATVTNTLMTGTNTAGVVQAAGIPGVGVRYTGALVAVAAGTPGLLNVLLD